MNKQKWIALGTGLILSVSAILGTNISFAVAEEEDSERVKFMKKMGGNAGPLGAVVRGEAEFHTDLAANAQAIADLSATLTDQFPIGSISESTKPEIWDNWDDFVSKASAVQQEATVFARLISEGDAAGYQAQFMTTLGKCKACHDQYRVPEEE